MSVLDVISPGSLRPQAPADRPAIWRAASIAALAVLLAGGPAAAQEHGGGQPAPAAQEHATPAPAAPGDGHQSPSAAGRPDHGQPSAAAGAGHGSEGEHGESPWAFLSRVANFLILAFGIWYFAKSPLGRYLVAKAEHIRHDLAHAERTRTEAQAQMASIEAQMRALPGELDALRARGAEEVAAEEARIRDLAAAERERLVEQTRREIAAHVRTARRDLARHAADLAVDVATARIRARITPDDHERLIDRYVTQVRNAHD